MHVPSGLCRFVLSVLAFIRTHMCSGVTPRIGRCSSEILARAESIYIFPSLRNATVRARMYASMKIYALCVTRNNPLRAVRRRCAWYAFACIRALVATRANDIGGKERSRRSVYSGVDWRTTRTSWFQLTHYDAGKPGQVSLHANRLRLQSAEVRQWIYSTAMTYQSLVKLKDN